MANSKGWLTKAEVLATGLPYYIPRSKRWTGEPYSFAVLLTKTRCKAFALPVREKAQEKPVAYLYLANAGSGTDDMQHRYVPLYNRTFAYEDIYKKLLPREMMGIPEEREGEVI